jgi:DNA-binding CsgD family transcriptional regulator
MSTASLRRRLTDDVVSKIVLARSADEVVRALGALSGELGYRAFRTEFLPSLPITLGNAHRLVSYTNQPEKWASELADVPREVKLNDPVWRHLERSTLPLIWGAKTYHDVQMSELYERCAGHGLLSGACLSLRGANNQLLAIGFSSDQAQNDFSVRPDLIGILYLAGATMLEHSLVVSRSHPAHDLPEQLLTPREREVLQWIAAGKTRWEISQILKIGERTVKFHVTNLIDKLGALNKQHAVVRAMHLGIL